MAAKKSDDKKKDPKVMDVSKPGKSAPSSTGRPIIVSHKPMAGDPMVKESDKDEEKPSGEPSGDEGEKITVKRTGPKVIKPLNEDAAAKDESAAAQDQADKSTDAEEDSPSTGDKAPTAPDLATAAARATERSKKAESESKPSQDDEQAGASKETDSASAIEEQSDTSTEEVTSSDAPDNSESEKPQPEETEDSSGSVDVETGDDKKETEDEASGKANEQESAKENKEDNPDAQQAATVGAVADQAVKKKNPAKQAQEDIKQQEQIKELIASKKYNLPIKASQSKRRMRGIAIAIAILLLLAGGYLALDAQIIENDFDLPIEFISDSQPEEELPAAASMPPEQQNTAEETEDPAEKTLTADDKEQQEDIETLATALEAYYEVNEHYPTLGQLNLDSFREENFADVDKEAFRDPISNDYLLSVAPTAKVYAYSASPAGCNNEETMCESFELTAILSDETTYSKQSLN